MVGERKQVVAVSRGLLIWSMAEVKPED